MAIVRRPSDGAMLVAEDADERGRRYQRPIGGSVEFGERAVDAIQREFREELAEALTDIQFNGVIENLFDLGTGPAHEVVFVFTARFAESDAYAVAETTIQDYPEIRVLWRSAEALEPPLVPAGLRNFL